MAGYLDDVDAQVLLADAAQVVDNRLYVLGGGWTMTGPHPVPFAVALRMRFPVEVASGPHTWELSLHEHETGLPLESPRFSGSFELTGEPGPDTPAAEIPLAITAEPLGLAPGRYVWRLAVDGVHKRHWSAEFTQL